MYWLGIWCLAWWAVGFMTNVAISRDHTLKNSGGYRLGRVLLSLPFLYFVWTAWQMYR